jgi:hypothetical protein
MRISPMRLGVLIVMVGLLCVTTPAHARRVRNVGNNPDNPQNPTQPVNIGAPQPAPANAAGTPNPYSNPYRSGVAQPSYTPNINNQPRPQYQPNAYVPPSPTPYNPAVSNPPAMPNTPPGSAPTASSGQANAAAGKDSFTVADQYPAKPPRVTFRNGQLTVLAENSTLPDILTAIHQRTGAALELPSALGTERVAAKLGPASTGEVLADLLNGSRFDYIVLNRLEDPSSPERIILRVKSTGDNNNQNNNNNGYNNGYNNVANAQPGYQPLPQPVEVPETVPEEEVPEEQPQPEPAVMPGGDQNNQGNAKTPEQLLEELRQLQQQRGQQPNQPQIVPQQPPLTDNNEPQ